MKAKQEISRDASDKDEEDEEDDDKVTASLCILSDEDEKREK